VKGKQIKINALSSTMTSVRKAEPFETQCFPTLSTTALHACLAALGITTGYEDFQKPTAAFVQFVYAALLETLMGVSMDALDQPRTSLLGMMEYKVQTRETLLIL
jgi:hypothetical protein